MQAARWSSQAGFLLATVGAAVELGNIWRFSAVVGQNGDGAYLVPYLIAAFLCAVPMLVLELAIGRRLRTDAVSAFRSVKPESYLFFVLLLEFATRPGIYIPFSVPRVDGTTGAISGSYRLFPSVSTVDLAKTRSPP